LITYLLILPSAWCERILLDAHDALKYYVMSVVLVASPIVFTYLLFQKCFTVLGSQ